MADKLRNQQQLESLQLRFIGTGHSDTTKHEWLANVARDTNSSYVGHPSLLMYLAVGSGVTQEEMRMKCIEGMVLPCGPAPHVEE